LSSILGGGVATRAVDGNVDGSFSRGSVTHTNVEAMPWWEVDLGQMATIEKLIVYNRSDSVMERLDNFTLKVLDNNRMEVLSIINCRQSEKITFVNTGN